MDHIWKREKIPEDAWNQEIHYQLTKGGKKPYELYSDGDPDTAS